MRDGKSPYLRPGPDNRVLKVTLSRSDLRGVLDDYLLVCTNSSDAAISELSGTPAPSHSVITTTVHGRKLVSADQLLSQLDRNAATGLVGEVIALRYELERLHKCGCAKPKDYIKHVALEDVGAGYDIESTWPGEERFIEVKSTTSDGSDFFITENECQVLAALGERAWLYRVVVVDGESGDVRLCLQDPIKHIASDCKVPVVWRVSGKALETVHG